MLHKMVPKYELKYFINHKLCVKVSTRKGFLHECEAWEWNMYLSIVIQIFALYWPY